MKVNPGDDLQKALDLTKEGEVVELCAGEYRAKITVLTDNLTIIGAGRDKTRIVFGDYALKKDEKGVAYNTFRTYTVAVCADGVTMKDLAVINDALKPEIKGQEVALTVYGDGFHMENCRLSSTQDTLFLGPLPDDLIVRYEHFLPARLRKTGVMRQYFDDCLIEGTVDFIFGCGQAVFDNCEIRSLFEQRGTGYIAAPAHELRQQTGFLFKNCRMTEEKGVAAGSVYLARPWRDYGLCVFENCRMGDHIAPEGFDKWNDTDRDRTARFYEKPAPLTRVKWINQTSR